MEEENKVINENEEITITENTDNNEIKITEVSDKYYLTEKVARYVLCTGTKTFKTPIKTDLDMTSNVKCI